tara:strand:+ start:7696 stop:7995 length:300 start_codon:yes stop_codon:yes gene_type:complete
MERRKTKTTYEFQINTHDKYGDILNCDVTSDSKEALNIAEMEKENMENGQYLSVEIVKFIQYFEGDFLYNQERITEPALPKRLKAKAKMIEAFNEKQKA